MFATNTSSRRVGAGVGPGAGISVREVVIQPVRKRASVIMITRIRVRTA
jgi:hypothetical protein